MSFFIFLDNIYFSMFNSSYAGYNHSEFREIIIILSIPTCAQMSAAMAKIYLTVYVFKVYPAFLIFLAFPPCKRESAYAAFR